MTALDRSVSSHSKHLMLVFSGLVVAATTLSLVLSSSSTQTGSKKVNLKDTLVEEPPKGDPNDWSNKQLLDFLRKVRRV